MKKSLIFMIILLFIGIGVALMTKFPQSNNTIQNQESSLSRDTEILQSGDNQLSGDISTGSENPLVYTNREFWFQLTLPEGWEDYKILIYSWTDKLPQSIVIALPTTMSWYKWVIDPNNINNFSPSNTWSYTYIKNYAVMLDMIILDKKTYEAEYKRCKEYQEPWCLGDVLWNNNLYYYIAIWPQSLTTDLDEKWWDRSYFNKIYKSFKIL